MYCHHCGERLPDNSNFCSKCGTPTNEKSKNDNKHKVTVFHVSQAYLLNPPINITVDERISSSVENGGTKEFFLDAGTHTFLFSSGLRKASLDVDLKQDVQITLQWNRITGSLKAALSS